MAAVLIVDENADSCHMLERFVTSLGHQAECVTTADSAFRRFLDRTPDLLVLDPAAGRGTSVLEFLRWLQASPVTRAVPVVVFTADDRSELRQRAQELGVREYLVKTATQFDQIQAAVRRLLPG